MRLLIILFVCLCLQVHPTHALQSSIITPENAEKLVLARQFDGGTFGGITWTADGTQVIVQRARKIEFYNPDAPEKPAKSLPNPFFDGRLLVSGEWLFTEYRLSLGRFNLHNGDTSQIAAGFYVSLAAISKDGQWLATGQGDEGSADLRVWNVRTGELLTILEGLRYGAEMLSFSDDGHTLFTVARGTVYRWQIDPAQILRAYRPLPDLSLDEIQTRMLSPHGDRFAIYNPRTKQIEIYDLRSEALIMAAKVSQKPAWLLFSDDGSRLAAMFDGYFSVWAIPENRVIGTWKRVQTYPEYSSGAYYPAFAFNADNSWIAYEDNGALVIRELTDNGRFHYIYTRSYHLTSAATGVLGTQIGSNLDTLYDWKTAAPQGSFPQGYDAQLTPDGQLYSFQYGNRLKIWEATTGQLRPDLVGIPALLVRLAITPDSRTVIAIGGDYTIRRFDLQTGKISLVQLPKPATVPASVRATVRLFERISNDGRYFMRFLGSNTSEWHVSIFDTTSGQLIRAFGFGKKLEVDPILLLSDDGNWLLFNQELWDMRQGKRLHTLNISIAPDRLIDFSHDGAILAYRPPLKRILPPGAINTGGPDDPMAEVDPKLQLISTQTGETLTILPDDVTRISGLAFSSDGQRLLLRLPEGTLKIYEVAS